MSNKNSPVDKDLSRRVFGILGLGTAGGAALAACQADTGGDGGADSEGEPDPEETAVSNPERIFHGAWPFEAPPTGHFNFAPGVTGLIDLGPGSYFHLLMSPGGLWDWAAEEWLYLLADSFEFDENRFVYNIAEGLTWSDGTDLTAEDVELTFWIRWLMNQQEWPMIAGLEASDDHQVTFDLDDPSTVFEHRIMKAPILPAAVYGEFGERAKELFESGVATDDPEANDLREEVQEWRPEDNETEVLTSGPYVFDFDSVSDASITIVKNEHGVLADEMHFEPIVVYNGETDDITPLVLDGTIDYATHGFPVSTQQQWEEAGYATKVPGVYSGMSLLFSMGNRPEFADARFRQAIAHAVDRHEAGMISLDESAEVSETMSGMPQLLAEQWLDEETIAELNTYEFDQDRAAELLEEAGWSYSNGQWSTPEGDRAEYQITFQANFADYPPSAQYYA